MPGTLAKAKAGRFAAKVKSYKPWSHYQALYYLHVQSAILTVPLGYCGAM